MGRYVYLDEAPTYLRGRRIRQGSTVELEGDDERVMLKHHNMRRIDAPEADTESDESDDTDRGGDSADGDDETDVPLKELAEAILEAGDYEDMKAFVNDELSDEYIQKRDELEAELKAFIEG